METDSEHDTTSKAEFRTMKMPYIAVGGLNRVHILVIALMGAVLVSNSGKCGGLDSSGAAFFDLSSVEGDLGISINNACVRYKLDCQLFTAMLMVESRLNYRAVNKRTQDYGIGQINRRTAAHYGFDLHKLVSDQDYSVNAAAQVFSQFKRSYAKKEPRIWVCRYNVGSGVLVGKKLDNCDKYLTKLTAVSGQIMVAYGDQ